MKPIVVLVVALALAASGGFLAAAAIVTSTQAPTKTVTIDVPTGGTGPAGATGPTGPQGEPGAESCPTGSTFTAVVINTPGGHTTLWTCVKDE